MTVSLSAPASRTRPSRTRIETQQTTPDLLVWLDPQELRRFGVHSGGTGHEDAERAEINMTLRQSIRHNGFDPAQPPLLVIDRVQGVALLKDGTHRTNYAADAELPRIPVRVRYDRLNLRFPNFPYRGEFESAPRV